MIYYLSVGGFCCFSLSFLFVNKESLGLGLLIGQKETVIVTIMNRMINNHFPDRNTIHLCELGKLLKLRIIIK